MSRHGFRPSQQELSAAASAILEANSDAHVKAEKVGITVRQLIGILKEQDPERVVVLAQNEWDGPGDFQALDRTSPVSALHYDAEAEDVGNVEDGFCTGDEEHCVPALVFYPREAR